MQTGPFIKFIADVYRVEAKTVEVYARLLKEAELLTTGARGVNAPHMLPLDAARLTIALLATDRPSLAVDLVQRYRSMKVNPDEGTTSLPEYLFGGDPTLEQVLVRIIALDPDPGRWGVKAFPYVEIRQNDKAAMLELQKSRAVFRDADRHGLSASDRAERGGIWRVHGLIPADVMRLATEMWVDRFRGCDVQGLPLSLEHSWNEELRGEARAQRHQEIYAYIRSRDANWRKGAD